MITLRYLLNVILVVTVAGCAFPRPGMVMPDDTTIYEIYSRVEFIDRERQPVKVEHPPKNILLLFPYIPGAIAGTFNTAPLESTGVNEDSVFRLDLGTIATWVLAQGTTPLNESVYTKGLIIHPASTRFARIATLAVDAETKNNLGPSSFIDEETREYLLLVYVDRPCSMTGNTQIGPFTNIYDVRLGHPGFHWLRAHQIGKRSFIVSENTDAHRVVFAIRVREDGA